MASALHKEAIVGRGDTWKACGGIGIAISAMIFLKPMWLEVS